MTLLVSACLLGCRCRYDAAAKPCPEVLKLAARHTLIPVCPEQLGGLPTPRIPAERRGGRVLASDGADVTDAFRRGAEEAARLYETLRCDAAVLKERSPSCGAGRIYDGTFSGKLLPGDGVTAELLRARGVKIYGETEIDLLRV